MPITTKKGDKGFTSLLGGKHVPKFHLRPGTYGTLDELNSFLGMARAVSEDRMVKETLLTIQNHLYLIGSELALSGKDRGLLKREIRQQEVDWGVSQPPLRCPLPPRPLRGEEGWSETEASVLLRKLEILDCRLEIERS